MGIVEVIKMEKQGGKYLFTIQTRMRIAQMDFPMIVEDQGTIARNEIAALLALQGLADEIAASIRHRLGSQQSTQPHSNGEE